MSVPFSLNDDVEFTTSTGMVTTLVQVDEELLRSALTGIVSGLEYARGTLAEHEATLGRTTHKNRLWAETIETDIAQIERTRIALLAAIGFMTPYIRTEIVTYVRLKNPVFGDDRICKCGHIYERHFDPFEAATDQDVGCKYCSCSDFVEA